MSADVQERIAAGCRDHSWQRLQGQLMALHVPAGSGPQVVAQWLREAVPVLQPEAQRVLRAIEHQPWQVHVRNSPYGGNADLGFRVQAGQASWWLRFTRVPRLRLVSIERVGA